MRTGRAPAGRAASRAAATGAAASAARRGRAGPRASRGAVAAAATAVSARACPASGRSLTQYRQLGQKRERRARSRLGQRPPDHNGAPLGSRQEAELLVQAPHRLVALLALGQEPIEPFTLGRGDLGVLEGRGAASRAA